MGSSVSRNGSYKHRVKRQYKSEVDMPVLTSIIIRNRDEIEKGSCPKNRIQELYKEETGKEVAVSHVTDTARFLNISFKWGGIRNANTDAIEAIKELEKRVSRIEQELGLSTT